MALDKVRIRFRKEGDLRLVSHHDLMRSFERMLRRAALPFRSTGGFHPTPRLVFASSLPLGMTGLAEVVEIEFTETVSPDDVLDRLRRQAPSGIVFLTARRIELRQTARACRGEYRLQFPAASAEIDAENLDREAISHRCQALLASSVLWVEREKPRYRRINIRPFVNALKITADAVQLDLWITPEGAARADEVARAIGLATLLEQGSVLERTFLEIVDELDPTVAALGPKPAEGVGPVLYEEPLEGPTAKTSQPAHVPLASWGASPNGPVVE